MDSEKKQYCSLYWRRRRFKNLSESRCSFGGKLNAEYSALDRVRGKLKVESTASQQRKLDMLDVWGEEVGGKCLFLLFNWPNLFSLHFPSIFRISPVIVNCSCVCSFSRHMSDSLFY